MSGREHTQRHRIAFLPGTSGAGSFWDPVRQRIPDVHSFALDWPGLGDIPPDPAISSFDDLVHFTIRSLDDLPTVLVGQSMGGFIAMRAALARPDLVSHLVLAVTSAGIDRAALGLPDWRPGVGDGHPSGASQWVAEPQPTLDAQIGSVDVATLLIWATDDGISPLQIGRRLHELLPNSELVIYESKSHWVVHDHADEIATHIRRLVSSAS
jgi:pimeloyl-ACP methyl ester carboxylesterase